MKAFAAIVLCSAFFTFCGYFAPPMCKPDLDLVYDAGPDENFPYPSDVACSKLRAWGCTVGFAQHCKEAFQLPEGFGTSPWCVIDASTPKDLEPCNVRCLHD